MVQPFLPFHCCACFLVTVLLANQTTRKRINTQTHVQFRVEQQSMLFNCCLKASACIITLVTSRHKSSTERFPKMDMPSWLSRTAITAHCQRPSSISEIDQIYLTLWLLSILHNQATLQQINLGIFMFSTDHRATTKTCSHQS